MMKKFVSTLTLFLMILVAGCGESVYDANKITSHTHEYGEWKVVKEANCVNEGLKERECACGDIEVATISRNSEHAYINGECEVCGLRDPSLPLSKYLNPDDAYSVNEYMSTKVSDADWLTDNQGNNYVAERVICNRSYALYEEAGEIEYRLDSNYSKLTGVLYVPDVSKTIKANPMPNFQVYGDGNLLYEISGVSYKDKPVNFDVNITGVDYVVVKLSGGWYRGDGTGLIPFNCIANLAVVE